MSCGGGGESVPSRKGTGYADSMDWKRVLPSNDPYGISSVRKVGSTINLNYVTTTGKCRERNRLTC